jgi:3D (Asp-Asp-Asp) domain-containing protein
MRLELVSVAMLAVACKTAGSDWVRDVEGAQRWPSSGAIYQPGPASSTGQPRSTVRIVDPGSGEEPFAPTPDEPADASRQRREIIAVQGAPGPFKNTYYDFPVETVAASDATLFNGSCKVIAKVSRDFHDTVCVQGSGRLFSGKTVSFARRGCECALPCPRSGQRICFDELDDRVFPWGRGSTGRPITPLYTVAVDASVIPLGSTLFIPEAVGLPRMDGSPHDGCFVAADRGMGVVGQHVDIFAGPTETRSLWNARLPSNRGVHVLVNDPRCPRTAG